MNRKMIIRVLFVVLCLAVPSTVFSANVIPMEAQVPNAIAARIPNSGFDFVTGMVTDLLNEYDINALILALNPLYDETLLKAEITQAHIGDVELSISSVPITDANNSLYAEARVYKDTAYPDESILAVYAKAIGVIELTLGIDVDYILLGMSITVDFPGGTNISATVDDLEVDLVGLSIDFGGEEFPQWATDLLVEAIEGLVVDMGSDLINDAIADALVDVVLVGDTSFSGYDLHYALSPRIFTDSTGVNFFSDMELYLAGDTVDTCVDPGFPVGSLYTNNPLGTFGDQTPDGEDYHIAAALSDDILNQVIFSVYAKGLLCYSWDDVLDRELTGQDFENLAGEKLPEEIRESLWRFSIYPNAVPVMDVGNGDNDLALVIDDMRIDWLVEKQGRYVELINANFDINLGVDVEMDEDNNLILTLHDPTIRLRIHGSQFNLLPEDTIENILNGAIGFFLPLLENLFPPIPIPILGGYTMTIQELAPMGPALDYLGIYLLVDQPTDMVLAMEQPDTKIVLQNGRTNLRGDHLTLNSAKSAFYGLKDGRSLTIGLDAVGQVESNHYFYSIDNMPWQKVIGHELTLQNLVEGPHKLEVAAKNRYNRMDESPAVLQFVCDNVAPEIPAVILSGNILNAVSQDYIDTDVHFKYRVDKQPWSTALPGNNIRVQGFHPGDLTIDVVAVDDAGNASSPTTLSVSLPGTESGSEYNADWDADDSEKGANGSDEVSAGGCEISGSGDPAAAIIYTLLLLLPILMTGMLRRIRIRVR